MEQLIVSPPIRQDLFLRQTCEDEEYLRPNRPDNGRRYRRGGHFAFDFQNSDGSESGDILYAVCDGRIALVHHGSSLGIQTVVRAKASDYQVGFLYCHQAERLVKEGEDVEAGRPIGIMGTTGRVRKHLHFEGNDPWHDWSHGHFNTGPQLRALQQRLRGEDVMAKLDEEDREFIEITMRNAVRAIVSAIAFGVNNPSDDWLRDDKSPWTKTLPNLRDIAEGVKSR